MFKRIFLCVSSLTVLSACVLQETRQVPVSISAPITADRPVQIPRNHNLKSWWSFYGDATLDRIISSALALNPQETKVKTTSLISDLIYSYLEYRYTQNQHDLLIEYITSNSLKKEEREALGTKKKGFEEKLIRIQVKITNQTKLLPEFVNEILKDKKKIPMSDMTPFLASETNLIDAYPNSFSVDQMNSFFGLNGSVFSSGQEFWNIIPGTARKNIISNNPTTIKKVEDLEKDLIAYTHLREQTRILEKASKRQNFSDSNTYYQSRLGVLRAQYEKAKAVTKIYLSLGVY